MKFINWMKSVKSRAVTVASFAALMVLTWPTEALAAGGIGSKVGEVERLGTTAGGWVSGIAGTWFAVILGMRIWKWVHHEDESDLKQAKKRVYWSGLGVVIFYSISAIMVTLRTLQG